MKLPPFVHKLHPVFSLRDHVDVRDLHSALVDLTRTWVQARAEVDPKSYGILVRDLSHPLVHNTNLAWVDGPLEPGLDRILDDLDTAFLGTDVLHRFVMFSDAQVAYDHQDAFLAAGFHPHAEIVMAKVGLPACIVNPDVGVREVEEDAPEADYRLVRMAIHDGLGYSPEESRQVYDVERIRRDALGDRAFVGYLRAVPAATYTLWPRGIFAVIGNVATLPAFRMHGVGRTMIFDACRRAAFARCEYVLLTTDLFDTPQAMYKTLGFEPVGELRGYLRRGP